MNDDRNLMASGSALVDPGLITYTHVIYALHALSVLTGVFTTASVIFSFVLGLPSIIGVIMNYLRRPAVRGTFLESHLQWQIRTFWFAALWILIVSAVSLVLLLVLVGFVTWFVGLAFVGLWVAYRVARGWIALRDRRPMYV